MAPEGLAPVSLPGGVCKHVALSNFAALAASGSGCKEAGDRSIQQGGSQERSRVKYKQGKPSLTGLLLYFVVVFKPSNLRFRDPSHVTV